MAPQICVCRICVLSLRTPVGTSPLTHDLGHNRNIYFHTFSFKLLFHFFFLLCSVQGRKQGSSIHVSMSQMQWPGPLDQNLWPTSSTLAG